MVVGVADEGRFIYWPSLSSHRVECRRKIWEDLYKPSSEKFDFEAWEFKEVKVIFREVKF